MAAFPDDCPRCGISGVERCKDSSRCELMQRQFAPVNRRRQEDGRAGPASTDPTASRPAPLGDEELRAIEARANAASPGPWWSAASAHAGGQHGYVGGPGGAPIADTYPSRGHQNAAFIANARTDIPRLLATIAARDETIAVLRKASERMREALEKVDELAKLEEADGDDKIWTDDYRDMIESARAALTPDSPEKDKHT